MVEHADNNAECENSYMKQMANKIENAKYNLDLMMRYRKQCDDKANIILAMFGVMATAIVMMSMDTLLMDDVKTTIPMVMIVSFAVFILGFAFLVYVVYPYMSTTWFKKGERIEYKSILYFQNIAESKPEDFKEEYKNYGDERYLDDILGEVYFTALACRRKFKAFRIGLLLSVMGLGSFIICLLIGFSTI